MSRVDEAMRRATQGGEPRPPVRAEGEDPQFVGGQDAVPAQDPEREPEPPRLELERDGTPRAIVRRPAAIPIDVARIEPRDEVQFLDILQLLWRRRKLLATVVVVCLAIAGVYNATATRLYQARARVIVEPESPAVVPFRPLTDDTGRFDYFTTQIEILRSNELANKALTRLALPAFPGLLTVTPTRSDLGASRVVNVIFTSTDPVMAARVVNTLAETYVDQNLELRRQGSRDAAKWLSEQLAELRNNVNASQVALQQYREEKNSVSLGEQQNIVLQRLEQLNANVTAARTERLSHEAVYEQLTAIEASGGPLDTLPPIASNGFIQGYKAELAALQRERAQLAERLGELHPDMIKVNSAIEAAEGRLKVETDKVVETIRNDFRTARARERALLAALDTQKREVLSLSQQSIGYGALQRDATSNQEIFQTVLQRLKETELSGELQANNVRILDAAVVPRVAISPRTWINVFVALFGGLFIAVGLILGLEYLNPRITRTSDIIDTLGLPLLGVTPTVAGPKNGRPFVGGLPPAFQDALRGIRARLLLSPTGGLGALAITSTRAGEGKTLIASGLAISMAASGRRVLLIDADMHRSELHQVFRVPLSPGLANILAGEAKPSDALLKSEITGLFILPAGADVANPSDLVDSERLSTLIDGFRKVFDVVVLDCPPVMAIADASIMANAASSVLFVVGAGTSTREDARAALERLASVRAHVIGAVLNNAKPDPTAGYYYTYQGRAEIT